MSIIRRGEWKLIEFLESGELELYNLAEDIGETRNLAKAQPELTAELLTKLKEWKVNVGAEPMLPNPQYVAKEGKR